MSGGYETPLRLEMRIFPTGGTEGPKAIQKAKKHGQLKYLSWKECVVAV